MSVCKIQMPGNYPEESIQHSEHGESLKSRLRTVCFTNYSLYLLQIYYYRQNNKYVPATRFQDLQYLDLDHECDTGSSATTVQSLKSPEQVQPTGTIYKTVDFVKTVAFNRTRQEVEEVRKQGTAAADL